MSHPISTHDNENEYPEDIETTEEEPEEEYTAEEVKQSLDVDSAVERSQLKAN